MCDIPLRASEEQLPWVQVTPYHRHNSLNLPRHLLYSTLHLLIEGSLLEIFSVAVVPYIMTIKNAKLMHECAPELLCMETARLK